MSIILSNGYKLPETGDFGSSYFSDLEDNIQRVNDHSHNGSDSVQLDAASILARISQVDESEFSLQSPGVFRALITLPPPMLVETTNISFRDIATKDKVYLKIQRFSTTQVFVFTNIAQSYEAIFTT